MAVWTFCCCFKSMQQRYVLAVMSSLAIIGIYMSRIVLYISITQMVKPPIETIGSTAVKNDFSCPMPNQNGSAAIGSHLMSNSMHEYDWSQTLQGYILSSFYVGYVLMHLPHGLLAEQIGGQPVILFAIFLSSTISLSTPFAIIYGGPYALIGLRFLLGCVQAGLYPSIATLLAAWVPQNERGRIGSMVYCAAPCGTIIGNFTAGLLMHHFKSWHIGFYVFGGLNIVMGVLFSILCSSNPASHPFISDEEKAYLLKELGQLEKDKNQKAIIPWKLLFTSSPVLALIFTMIVGDWAYYTILIDLPKYMNDVLNASVKENGIISALPWAMCILVSLLSGIWSDYLISSGQMGITNVRKLFVTISSIIGGAFIMAAAYGGCDLNVVGTFFTIAVGAQGFMSSSICLNVMDLCPNYAGMLSGVIGVFACCMGILVPIAVSFLTPNSLQSEWRVVFWITLFASIAQLVVFDIWGSANVQTWNNPIAKPSEDEIIDTTEIFEIEEHK